MWLLLAGLAMAGKFDGAETDIIVEGDVDRPQEELFELFTSFPEMAKVFPSDCVKDWGYGVPSEGVGATTVVTYHMGPMKRRLTGHVTKAEEHYVVEWDHDGKKGFVTQFVLEPNDDGTTHVKLGSYIAAPPWPFKPLYFNKVKPEWEACYREAMSNLGAK